MRCNAKAEYTYDLNIYIGKGPNNNQPIQSPYTHILSEKDW